MPSVTTVVVARVIAMHHGAFVFFSSLPGKMEKMNSSLSNVVVLGWERSFSSLVTEVLKFCN
jgi:hypothetical protein